jgi:hypothetical protein
MKLQLDMGIAVHNAFALEIADAAAVEDDPAHRQPGVLLFGHLGQCLEPSRNENKEDEDRPTLSHSASPRGF